jgi:SAM-dependent methyltransferase
VLGLWRMKNLRRYAGKIRRRLNTVAPRLETGLLARCPVCGGSEFVSTDVLWRELIEEWQLGPDEVAYINRQQGFHCRSCGASLRAMVLAHAICSEMEWNGTLNDWAPTTSAAILEINEAERLTPILKQAPKHRLVSYPETDMHALPFGDDSFDLIVHSDTLEHVANPGHALFECRRVLRPHGVLAFTVPVIVDRLTRSRDGLSPSYHGEIGKNEYLVQTEFGADFWTLLPRAGFESVTIHTLLYPAGLAVSARK